MNKFIMFLLFLSSLLTFLPNFAIAENTQLKNAGTKYYRIAERDLKKLERQALLNKSLLQRIRDLEHLYKQIESLTQGIRTAITYLETFLGIDLGGSILGNLKNPEDHFEHISGVIMEPGAVSFNVKTRYGESFDELGLNKLEFDLYYNKKLFSIDHIEGDKVLGEEFSTQSLSKDLRAIKDRIELPLTDVLSDQAEFKVYLAPNEYESISVGDKTFLQVRYYKRIPKNPDGTSGQSPLIYELSNPNKNFIEVVVK
jgi:hypothetical protein